MPPDSPHKRIAAHAIDKQLLGQRAPVRTEVRHWPQRSNDQSSNSSLSQDFFFFCG